MKNYSSENKATELRSDSTMASFHQSSPSDRYKSPLNSSVKNNNSRRIQSKKTIIKYPRMYLVKQSPISIRKTPGNILEEPLQSYYAGISIPIMKKENIEYDNLEYLLKGSNNSVNCLDSLGEKLISGGSDCYVRYWSLPLNTIGAYTSKTYTKGSVFNNNIAIGKHKKSVISIARCGEIVASGSIDGILKF